MRAARQNHGARSFNLDCGRDAAARAPRGPDPGGAGHGSCAVLVLPENRLTSQEALVRPTHLFRFPRLTGAAAALLLLAACGGESTTEPPEPLGDLYVLVKVQGASDPLIIGEHRFTSGTRQIYTLLYDSLKFTSETQGRRSFRVMVETLDAEGAIVPPVFSSIAHGATITRRGDRVILSYATINPIPPDTFDLSGPTLVKQGPFGVQCATCAPLRRVEYVYEAR